MQRHFLDELNDIEIFTSDINNEYLTARTTKNILFNAGPELDPFLHAGHLLLIQI